MKKILIMFLLCFNAFGNQKPHDLLDSIENYSINIGKGKTNEVYVFVDPMCPFSKKFIKKITENKILQLINTYHIFLYRLPKFDSDKVSYSIYKADDNKEALIDFMVNEKDIKSDNVFVDHNIIEHINEVAIVAKKLNIKKRPYMILYESDSGYCRVSEGSAPCMEEFDFE